MSASPQITQKNNARRNRRSNRTRKRRRAQKKMMFTDSNSLSTAVLPQSSTTLGSSDSPNGGRSSGIVTHHSMNEWHTEIIEEDVAEINMNFYSLPSTVLSQSSTTLGSSDLLKGSRSSGIVTRHSMNEWNIQSTIEFVIYENKEIETG